MKPAHPKSFPLLRTILGDEYTRFEKEVLVRSLEELAGQQKISKKALKKVVLGLEKGNGFPTTEEIIDQQTRTNRAGGALVNVTIDVPGIPLQTFVKVHTDKAAMQREAGLTKILHDELKSRHVLQLRYSDERNLVLATPFINAERAQDAYQKKRNVAVVQDCLQALLDTYERASKSAAIHKLVPQTKKSYVQRFEKSVLSRIAGKTVKATDSLQKEYQVIDNSLKNAPQVLLHGDPNLSNFLVNKSRTYIIDWESSRRGSIHSDVYRLLARAGVSAQEKKELLEQAYVFVKEKFLWAGDLELFLKQYALSEVHEHLFTAAQFKELAHTTDMKKEFDEAASVYYTKAVNSAKAQGLDKLAQELASAAGTLLEGNVRVLSDEEFTGAEKKYSLCEQGFSTLLQHSLPADEKRVVSDIKERLEKKERQRSWKKRGVAAGAIAVIAGLSTGIAFSIPKKTVKETVVEYAMLGRGLECSSPREQNDFPELKKHIDTGELGWLYWYMDEEKWKGKVNISHQTFKDLFETPKYQQGGKETGKYGLLYNSYKRVGIPSEFVYGLYMANAIVKKSNERDEATGLPKSVLAELAKTDSVDKIPLEQKVALSLEYFRNRIERNQLRVGNAFAEYYCGSDALYHAQWAAAEKLPKDRQIKYAESKDYYDFWKFAEFLPDDGRELAVIATYLGWKFDGEANEFGPAWMNADLDVSAKYKREK